MRGALLAVALCVAPALALARAKPARRVVAAAPKASPPPPALAEKPSSTLLPPEQQVERAERLFATLEYDQALPLARAALLDPSLSLELRIRALTVEASTLAITSDVADAERPFRKLLRIKPDFELPPKSPPKILGAFRKVQTEEKLLAEELEATRLKRQVARLKLLDELPPAGKGGRALKLSLRVFDPDGTVNGVRVPYRRAGEKSWSVLALARDETGAWAGALPGEVTASADDYALEAYVVTLDAKGGALLTHGSESVPLKVDVAAGTPRRVSLPRGVFFTSLALTAGAGVAAGVFRVQLASAQAEFDRKLKPDGFAEVSADTALSLKQNGELWATATNAMLITTAALAVITLAIGLWLVDWSS